MGIMKVQILMVTISSFHFIISEDAWRQTEGEKIDFPEYNEFSDDVFNDIAEKDVLSRNEMRRFSSYQESPNAIMDMKKSKKEIYQYGRSSTPCSCFVKYTLLELGYMYSPRKLLTTVCDSSKCGNFYQCNEKKYGITVMKKKTRKEKISSNSPTLSRDSDFPWVSEVKYVTVACDCMEM